ncbi:MAG: CHAT domain-containing protein [Desulfobacterales bacterium]|nr:CHAT domain-containing protein [Desulfobacterales bacterium]
MMELTDWHHLIGLTDFFTETSYDVTIEEDLSKKKQIHTDGNTIHLLDIVEKINIVSPELQDNFLMRIALLRLLTAFLLLTVSYAPAYAQVNLDGTIGTAGKLKLPGPNYYIEAAYGEIAGKNLFHSFETFNINAGESATFNGPDSVQNIISRVTGGNASWIDGKLRSEIFGADLYLLNPAGVMFGPNASLDLGGSFHVSTADYLRMGNNERFYSMPHENDVLSTAAPTAFGFLDGDIAPVSIEGRGEILKEEWNKDNPTGLNVSEGNTISVIGGNIEIKNGTFFKSAMLDEIVRPGELAAYGGRINIASVASSGEVVVMESGLDISLFNELGNIDISGKSVIDVSGEKGGNIYIKGGDFVLDDSAVYAYGFNDAGNISIETERSSFANGALVSCSAYGLGVGGNIVIRSSESVSLYGNDSKGQSSVIEASGYNSDAGNVEIETNNLSLKDDAQIHTVSLGTGNGGDITINAYESVIFSGSKPDRSGNSIATAIGENADTTGKAGDVSIETKNISLNDGAWIGSYTEGKGKGGNVTIRASESVNLSGINGKGRPSIISAASLEVFKLTVQSFIRLTEEGVPEDILDKLNKLQYLKFSSADNLLNSLNEYIGEEKTAQYKNLILKHASSIGENENGGNAGEIFIETKKLTITDRGALSVKAEKAGGGKVTINADGVVWLSDADIVTSVKGGTDDAGNISIDNPEFFIMNQTNIKAEADEGSGGDIAIVAGRFIQSYDSIVDASSEKGIDGIVSIKSPVEDIARGFTVLADNFPDADHWMKTPCSARSGEDAGTFTVSGRDGIPTPIDDFLASPPLAFVDSDWEEYRRKGDFENVVLSLEHAVNSLNAEEDTDKYLEILQPLASAYQAVGHYKKALAHLEKALPFAEKSSDISHKAVYFSMLGDLYLCIGNMKKAEKYLEKGIDQAHQAGDPHIMASVLNNMGIFLAADGDYHGAAEVYEKSPDLLDQVHSLPGLELKSKILINLLRLRIMGNDAEEIFTAMDNALLHTENLPDSHTKALDLISLSLLVQKIMEKPYAGERFQTDNLSAISSHLLKKANLIAENLQNTRIASYACGYLGQIYGSGNNIPESLSLTRRAVFLAQQGYFPEILYLWQWQLGKLFSTAGDTESAIQAYNRAISTLNPVRKEFFTGYRYKKDRFNNKVRPVYSELAELLLDRTETRDRSENRLGKARDVMELLKTAELQDFFQDECVTAVQKEKKQPNRSHPSTAVIYPVSLPDRLVLLMLLPDGMKQINVPVDSETLRKNAELFISRLRSMKKEKRIQYYGKPLYDWLIRPAEAELSAREIDTLIVAPDGILRLIPFSALYDGEHYLIEKYALAVIPAITLTDFEPVELKNPRILLAGLSEEAIPPLESVKKELEDIRMIMEHGQIVLDKDFTNDNLKNEFSGHEYTVVHISTHGSFGNDPADTYLQVYPDERLTMGGLENLVRLGRFRDRKVDLLALSACRTAEGDERAALGLAGVAVKAGVRSAIASLWYIEANASSLLVTEFYRELNTGISKAKALQNAQKKLVDHSGYSHPSYWSPFLLIGNWL